MVFFQGSFVALSATDGNEVDPEVREFDTGRGEFNEIDNLVIIYRSPRIDTKIPMKKIFKFEFRRRSSTTTLSASGSSYQTASSPATETNEREIEREFGVEIKLYF